MRTIERTTQFKRDYKRELSGEWADHRDCHVKPDLVLIYQKPDALLHSSATVSVVLRARAAARTYSPTI